MLRRLSLRDVVIVPSLELEFDAGFTVLTGETGAGKSILVDALQLALGGRGDALVVREGAQRAEVCAEFDATPDALRGWLADAGFDSGDNSDALLLRRVIDAGGRSRAWINGGAATVAQLREAADALLDIHGQHAWQSLARPAAVRALLDVRAGVDAAALAAAFTRWKAALDALDAARSKQGDIDRERERLSWQIGELDKLAPGADEWSELDAEHQRLANAQSLIEAARGALDLVAEADGDANASRSIGRAIDALDAVARYDARLAATIDVLRGALAQLDDTAHTLSSYLGHLDLDPDRLAEVDARMSAWMALARRWRRPPAELPVLHEQWRSELRALDAATDLDALAHQRDAARADYDRLAREAGKARAKAAPRLAADVTQAMQQLGMAGGRLEVALLPQDAPQSFGTEGVELLVAGHAGSTPRPLAKVASGGELSRIALAVAVTTAAAQGGAPTLIFDAVDAGVGGAVAGSVGRLLKQLGSERQVLCVTHLPQVAACADHHFVVSKAMRDGTATTDVTPARGESRVAEIARMLGGGDARDGAKRSDTSLAHASELLLVGAGAADAPRGGARR